MCLDINKMGIKLWKQTCQNPDIRTNGPCDNILLWTSFWFLQGNQQKYLGMISTNNV